MGDTGGACRVWWGNVRERELVARMGDTGGACRVWWGNMWERDSLWYVWETLEVRAGSGGET